MTRSRVLIVLAFAAVYLIWGSTYLAIRYAIETLPPFLMAGSRFFTAGLILFAWAAYVNPVVAVLLGWLFASEPLTPRMLIAAAIIVGSVALITSYATEQTNVRANVGVAW
jgi:drug/metabolite transporter (DMT)-like permease